ncbi:uncharacterized protein LOC110116898 [Athalia rosae]|uniref:uncharacterized protein LOC110116898 n=1 Tax=Athalia rosae TaxID=37344 RepID=UPI0020344DD2|nr:uncharacterized protein LOC110116898 [Athalia rosae]
MTILHQAITCNGITITLVMQLAGSMANDGRNKAEDLPELDSFLSRISKDDRIFSHISIYTYIPTCCSSHFYFRPYDITVLQDLGRYHPEPRGDNEHSRLYRYLVDGHEFTLTVVSRFSIPYRYAISVTWPASIHVVPPRFGQRFVLDERSTRKRGYCAQRSLRHRETHARTREGPVAAVAAAAAAAVSRVVYAFYTRSAPSPDLSRDSQVPDREEYSKICTGWKLWQRYVLARYAGRVKPSTCKGCTDYERYDESTSSTLSSLRRIQGQNPRVRRAGKPVEDLKNERASSIGATPTDNTCSHPGN